MTYEFRSFMHRQVAVVRLLLKTHHLEKDVVNELLDNKEFGNRLRDCCKGDMPVDSIANEMSQFINQ